MKNFEIVATEQPGSVTFDNYENLKAELESYISARFAFADYEKDGLEAAVADRDELKAIKDNVSGVKKSLEKAYSAPYKSVEAKLDELVKMIDEPLKKAKSFVDTEEAAAKRKTIMEYAEKQAAGLGEFSGKVLGSPAFFNEKWLNKTCTAKSYQEEINQKIANAEKDLPNIQKAAGENAAILTARYLETLSMEETKSFAKSISGANGDAEAMSVPSEKNAIGSVTVKITATEDMMASILDQLALMDGVQVEIVEDNMPKPMEELTVPEFDSFVAFDIETTGTRGAANGDGEAKITEIGAVKVVNGEIVDTFDMLANPGRDITPMVARLTHITNEMVADQPPVDDVIRRFREFVGESVLVGHNIKASDLRYITKAADAAGVHFDGSFLDTYLLAKQFRENQKWENVKLETLSAAFGLEHKEAHRAWSDAEVNAKLYFELQKLAQ